MGRCRPVVGSWVVNGHWRYASGCDYCAHLVAGAEAEGAYDKRRPLRWRFLLPIVGMEIIDDRHVMGLVGTGSKSLRVRDLFVPEWLGITDHEFLTNTGPGRKIHDHCRHYRLSRATHPGPLSLPWPGSASPNTRSITVPRISARWGRPDEYHGTTGDPPRPRRVGGRGRRRSPIDQAHGPRSRTGRERAHRPGTAGADRAGEQGPAFCHACGPQSDRA